MVELEVHECECEVCRGAEEHSDRERHRHLNVVLSRLDEQQRRWVVVLESERLGMVATLLGHARKHGRGGRFRYSLHCLEKETGLHRESIVDAKRRLAKLGIIDWIRGDDGCDLLSPNAAFRVIVTPASEGRCTLAFARGSDSGQ